MRRRAFLGTLALTTLSGCVEGVSGDETTEKSETSDRVDGPTGTQRSEKTEISDSPGGGGSEAIPEQQRSGGLEVDLHPWRGQRSLRYYNETQGSVDQLDPTRSWWLQARVRVSNIGSQTAELPDISDFSVRATEERSPVGSFERIDRDQLRLRSDGNIFAVMLPGDHIAEGEIKPGAEVSYAPLFDVGELEELSLAWETQGGTKHLANDVVHLGD